MTSANSTPTLRINNIERAAIVEAVTGEIPAISYNGQSRLCEFSFPRTQPVTDCILQIDNGLMVEAVKLIECRTRLFKRIKGVTR